MSDKANLETLEAMIDSIGLERTVHVLGQVCADKAEHIAVNWQDASSAKPWAKAGALIDVLAIKIKNLEL